MFIRNKFKIVYLWLILLVVIIAVSSGLGYKEQYGENDYDGIIVRYVDVGQGDCEIVQLPDGRNIMIDGGPNSSQGRLVTILRTYGIDKIDYLIATHPHEDHIGGLDMVVKYFDIGNVYMPKVASNSDSFLSLANEIKAKSITVNEAKAGVRFIDEEEITAEFLSPVSDTYDNTNNYSAVVKITYRGAKFLFTGDAEVLVEEELLESGADLKSDVLKLGHHGSITSSSAAFLRAVNPKFIVIEVGEDNSYGHPHKEVLERIEGISTYRTDMNGNISFKTDGNKVDIYTEK